MRELVTVPITGGANTLTVSDIGKTITNYGATAAVTIVLPTAANCPPGGDIVVLSAADQNLLIAPATSDTLVGLNDVDLDSVALSTSSEKIGGGFTFTCLGAAWHVLYHTEETQTVTSVD